MATHDIAEDDLELCALGRPNRTPRWSRSICSCARSAENGKSTSGNGGRGETVNRYFDLRPGRLANAAST
jgi:hypothetical protein